MIRARRVACAGCGARLAFYALVTTPRPWAPRAALCQRCDDAARERWEWTVFDQQMAAALASVRVSPLTDSSRPAVVFERISS